MVVIEDLFSEKREYQHKLREQLDDAEKTAKDEIKAAAAEKKAAAKILAEKKEINFQKEVKKRKNEGTE